MSCVNNRIVDENDNAIFFLKKHFPKYRINNASQRTKDELLKIFDLCEEIPDLIIYIKRNEKNDEFFKECEIVHNTETLTRMIYNKKVDSCFKNEDNEMIESSILCFKKAIEDRIGCVICYENSDNMMLYCQICGSQCCIKCILKMLKSELNDIIYCPICRTGVIYNI